MNKKKKENKTTAKKIIALSMLFVAVAVGGVHARGRGGRGRVRVSGSMQSRGARAVRGGGRGSFRHYGGRRRGRVGVGVGFGHRGRRGGRIGFGVGFGHRGHYYRPWYRRPWRTWWSGDSAYYSWEDNRGRMYWRIRNHTGHPIQVSSDTNSINLDPNESRKLYRGESFKISVRNRETGQVTYRKTSNHNVTID